MDDSIGSGQNVYLGADLQEVAENREEGRREGKEWDGRE